jgi:hypothetical protein
MRKNLQAQPVEKEGAAKVVQLMEAVLEGKNA